MSLFVYSWFNFPELYGQEHKACFVTTASI